MPSIFAWILFGWYCVFWACYLPSNPIVLEFIVPPRQRQQQTREMVSFLATLAKVC